MAPGATVNRGSAPLPPRRLRSPMHPAMLANVPEKRLQPWMGALVMPGDTVVGASLMGDVMFRRMLQMVSAPLTWSEVGVWRVPLSALGPAFLEIIVNSSDDAYELLQDSEGHLLGVPLGEFAQGSQGQWFRGLQSDHRAWAGEVGYADADTQELSARYAPYISHATWLIANAFYELDWFRQASGVGSGSTALFDFPPVIGKWIRGASAMRILADAAGVDDISAITSAADLLQYLSLVKRPDMTWSEYLIESGTPLSRVSSIPEPLFIEQRKLRRIGSAQVVNAGQPNQGIWDPAVRDQGVQGDATHNVDFVNNDVDRMHLIFDGAGVNQFGANFDSFRRRSMRIYEPSILVGTCVWSSIDINSEDMVHRMDATMAINSGHWGAHSDMDEGDFIRIIQNRDPQGENDEPDDLGQNNGPSVVNMLNHYMYGDTFIYPLLDAPGENNALSNEFRYRGAFGRELFAGNLGCNYGLAARMHIMSKIGAM